MRIQIENEDQRDPHSLFRVMLDKKVVGEHLTAPQAHIVIGEIFEALLRRKTREKPLFVRDAIHSLLAHASQSVGI